MKRVLLPLLLILAACGTPQERCISRNTKDLRTVEKLIQETEGNLARGYAIQEYRYYDDVLTICYGRNQDGSVYSYGCYKDVLREGTRPKKIDLKAEAVTLEGLKEKRIQLETRAKSVVAQCQALHPEEIKP